MQKYKIISKLFEQKAKEIVLKSVDFRTIYGIPTACGYNAPCFDSVVHIFGTRFDALGQWGQKEQTLDSACHPK